MPSAAIATNPVTEVVASPEEAVAHYQHLLTVETDCWDVKHMLDRPQPGFVLFDTRGPEEYAAGHIPRAISLPYRRMTEASLADYPMATLFVVYCAGPHCNGADRAALRLASLGRPVRKMIGGVTGWRDNGFDLVAS